MATSCCELAPPLDGDIVGDEELVGPNQDIAVRRSKLAVKHMGTVLQNARLDHNPPTEVELFQTQAAESLSQLEPSGNVVHRGLPQSQYEIKIRGVGPLFHGSSKSEKENDCSCCDTVYRNRAPMSRAKTASHLIFILAAEDEKVLI
jgi:hypothetical protein